MYQQQTLEQIDLQPYKRVVCHLRPIFQEHGSVALWTEIARQMNNVNQGRAPWTWRYMLQVYNGNLKPSARFMRAAMVLEQQLESSSPLAASAQALIAFTIAGRVKPGSIILGSSRTCERQGCNTSYVPVVPWQRFCCKECRLQNSREVKKYA
jgi:hypothetical protein